MQIRIAVALGLAVLAGCGADTPPAAPTAPPPAPAPAQPAAEPEAAPPIGFLLDGSPWQIDVAGGTYSKKDEYVHQIATPTFTLDLQEWPTSQVFIQTLGDHLADVRKRDPSAAILHQDDGGEGKFTAVVKATSAINGVVLLPGHGTGGMCSFDLPADGDWKAALAACTTLRPSEGGTIE
jgi:hypothetical protein